VKTVVVVQARLGSTRLPRKALLPLAYDDGLERPMVAHTVERACAMGYPVVGAIPEGDRDELGPVMYDAGCKYVTFGPEEDVLSRVHQAAVVMQAEVVVRVTGDCPLYAPDVGKRVIRLQARNRSFKYVSNDTERSGWPDGTDTEVFTFEALEEAWQSTTASYDREHVTPWIRRRNEIDVHWCNHDWISLKLSVDEAADHERVQSIMAHLRPGQWTFAHTLRAAWAAGVLPRTPGTGVVSS
jgi:spore coat polysaccharide biosynthesis protein SpsF (cytidylyltransferase family)